MSSRLLFAVTLLAAVPAHAQDPKFDYGKPDDVKDVKAPVWTGTAEFGLLFTTGNAETTSISGGFHTSRKAGDNKFALEATGAYAKSGVAALNDLNGNGLVDNQQEITTQETITAEQLNSRLRYDRYLTNNNSLYIAALASRDTPAGKLSQFGGQAGYSRQLYKSKLAETVAELGADYSRETLTVGDPISIISGRAFIGEHAIMAQDTVLDTSLEALTNFNRETLPTGKDGGAFKDTRVNLKVAISAKIGENLAVQTSFEARFDNRPGPLPIKPLAMGFVPEASEVETIMKASLIYTFVNTEPPKKPAAPPDVKK